MSGGPEDDTSGGWLDPAASGSGVRAEAEAETVAGGQGALRAETVPERVGRFLLLEPLGRGGLGQVYAAYDPKLDRKVAVKQLLHGGSAETHARFLREAKLLAQMSHPNIVPIFEVGETHGELFIAMELVDGIELGRWCAQARSWVAVLGAYVQAGRGLAAAHERGLVHRDFKPANVMVGMDKRPRVLDFGLAARISGPSSTTDADDERSDGGGGETLLPVGLLALGLDAANLPTRMTPAGTVMGTPAYMSPEQRSGVEVGPASDQYSFCVALHEALYGHRPADPVPEVCWLPNPPDQLRSVLARGLSDDRGQRWPSMNALLEALDGVRRANVRSRTRRRVGLGVAGALAVGGAAVGVRAWLDARVAAGCRATAEGRMAQAYGEEGAVAIVAAFEQSELPFAARTQERVSGELDDYAKRWVDGHADACVQGSLTSASAGPALSWCFEVRVDAVAAVARELARADSSTVATADGFLRQIPNLDACVVPQQVARLPSAPADPIRAGELARGLGEAAAAERAGRREQAEAKAADILDKAQAAGLERIAAMASVRLGLVQSGSGDSKNGGPRLEAGFFGALALHDFDTATSAATALVWHSPDALLWAELARYALRQTGVAADHPRFTEIERKLVHSDLNRSDFDAAATRLEDVIARRSSYYGPEHPMVADARVMLAGIEGLRGNIDRAVDQAELAVRVNEEVFGPRHPRTANGHGMLANGYLEQGRAEESLAHALRYYEGFVATYGEQGPKTARALHSVGTAQHLGGRNTEALATLRQVEALYAPTAAPEVLAVNLRVQVAVLYELGEVDEGLKTVRRAIALTDGASWAAHDERRLVLRRLLCEGLLESGELDLAQAEANALEAIYAAGPASNRATPTTAELSVHLLLGRIALAAGDAAVATTEANYVLAAASQDDASHPPATLGQGSRMLAEAALAQGRRDEAAAAYAQGLAALEDMQPRPKRELGLGHRGLAELHRASNPRAARRHARSALEHLVGSPEAKEPRTLELAAWLEAVPPSAGDTASPSG